MIDHKSVQIALRTHLLTIAASGLPTDRAWENVAFEPTTGTSFVSEEYLPGPMAQITLGAYGELEVLPTYVLKIFAPEGGGIGTAADYADALLAHFAPGTAITVGSDTMHVRRDPAPYRGQLLRLDSTPGFAVVVVTIPLRLRTANSV